MQVSQASPVLEVKVTSALPVMLEDRKKTPPRIPIKYISKYGVENAWRVELADRWRMIYSINGDKIEITIFVMDVFNHKDHDKVFGY